MQQLKLSKPRRSQLLLLSGRIKSLLVQRKLSRKHQWDFKLLNKWLRLLSIQVPLKKKFNMLKSNIKSHLFNNMLKSQFMNKSNSMKSQFTNKSQYMSKSQFINKNNNISLAQRFMKLNLFISHLQDNISKKLQK